MSGAVSYTHLDVYKRQVQGSEAKHRTNMEYYKELLKETKQKQLEEEELIQKVKMCIRDRPQGIYVATIIERNGQTRESVKFIKE